MISVDLWAVGLAVILLFLSYLLYRWNNSSPQPEILFSNSGSLPPDSRWRAVVNHSPRLLELAAFTLLILAFIDPHMMLEKSAKTTGEPPSLASTEGIAIYFVLDQSGSMAEKVEGISKMDRLKGVVSAFIKENRGNMIGLVGFARGAQVLSPLTLDQNALQQKISDFSVVKEPSQDGTAIGYGIYKAATLIAATKHYAREIEQDRAPAYDIKDAVMILVTDGIQDPNPLDEENPLRTVDIPEAAAYAKQEGIRLYIVNVEPRLEQDKFAAHRSQMQKAAEATGGRFFIAASPDSLAGIIKQIDGLEKSRFPLQIDLLKNRNQTPFLYERIDFYPYLIGLALFLLAAAILIQTIWLRRVP